MRVCGTRDWLFSTLVDYMTVSRRLCHCLCRHHRHEKLLVCLSSIECENTVPPPRHRVSALAAEIRSCASDLVESAYVARYPFLSGGICC